MMKVSIFRAGSGEALETRQQLCSSQWQDREPKPANYFFNAIAAAKSTKTVGPLGDAALAKRAYLPRFKQRTAPGASTS